MDSVEAARREDESSREENNVDDAHSLDALIPPAGASLEGTDSHD